LLDLDAVARLVPTRQPDAHKGDCGHLLVVAGSFGKTGAAQLVTRAALRVGAGLVTVVGPASLYPIYASAVLEAMTDVLPDRDGRILFEPQRLRELAAGKSAVVIGPGIGTHEEACQFVRWLLDNSTIPLVLDADALTCVAADTSPLSERTAPTVLTPHPGEMARLLGTDTATVQADRVGVARRFAESKRCVLILKGARTVIAEPSSHAWINPTGNPGMASGGMGDVLCGIVGGLLAQRLEASEAARLGVYLHGASADRAALDGGEIGLVASDVSAGLRPGLRILQRHLRV
jgi:NAD(P)H-hydrate epimerase